MTKDQKLAILRNRYNVMMGRPAALKSQGVLRKLKRQIRNFEKEIGNE